MLACTEADFCSVFIRLNRSVALPAGTTQTEYVHRGAQLALSALLIFATIAASLTIRLAPLALPKYVAPSPLIVGV